MGKLKLLLIAGYFPPVRISVGSIRPWNLARCLIDLGWDVTVVTPKISIWDPKHLDNIDQVKKDIEEMGIKMIYTDQQLRCLAPWRYALPKGKLYWFFGGLLRVTARFLGVQNWFGWVPSALYACRKLQPDDVDVILATGAPFWGFEIAYRLSKRLKRPYVMDYRDLWTNNPWAPNDRKWVAKHEGKLLKKNAATIAVSPMSGELLSKKYNLTRKVRTITNGYDQIDVLNVQEKLFSHFSIIFAGMLLPPRLTLSPLLKALEGLKKKDVNYWKFHYFGPSGEKVNQEIIDFDLGENMVLHGNIPRKDVLTYIKGASLNVVLSSNTKIPTMEEKGVIPGKIYELIGMGASILSIVPEGSAVERILNEVGIESFSPDDIKGIQNYIIEYMNGRKDKIINKDKYVWENLAEKFDIVLRDIIENHDS